MNRRARAGQARTWKVVAAMLGFAAVCGGLIFGHTPRHRRAGGPAAPGPPIGMTCGAAA